MPIRLGPLISPLLSSLYILQPSIFIASCVSYPAKPQTKSRGVTAADIPRDTWYVFIKCDTEMMSFVNNWYDLILEWLVIVLRLSEQLLPEGGM